MQSLNAILPDQSGRVRQAAKYAATVLFAGLITPAFMTAAALSGNLSLSSAGADTIAVNGSVIDFDYSGGVTSSFPPLATGTVDGTGDAGLFNITAASTSSFAPLAGSLVTVHDLSNALQPTGSLVGPGLPLNNFITFSAQPTWSIALTEVLPGVDGSADCLNPTGIHCTPAGSPFNLDNEAGNQVLVGFSFLGIARDGLGNNSNVAGTFSTTFSNTSYQAMLVQLNNGQSIVSSANATIGVTPISGVPEPKSLSMLLLGSGLLAVSLIYRRRHQRP